MPSPTTAQSGSSPGRDTPLEVRDLVVGYGSRIVIRGVDLDLHRGEILGLLGPNGAGKTTLIRRMAGLLPSKAGTVRVDGGDPAGSRAARARIGYMPEAPPLYPEDNVLRYVEFRAALQGIPRTERRSAAREALDRAGALGLQSGIIGRLSKGQRQRVALAAAIVHRPDVVLLDEPGDGLDPRQTVALRQLLRALSLDSAVLVSTHLLAEAQQTCDRVVILDQGALVLASAVGDDSSARLRVRVDGPDLITLRRVLAEVNGVTAVDDDAVCTVISLDVADDIAAAVRNQGWKLRELAAGNGRPRADLPSIGPGGAAMTGAWRIARREYRAYLTTPWCYGLAVAFLFLTGLIFFLAVDGSREASLRFWFPNLAFVNLLTIPVITSRTIAEEKRTAAPRCAADEPDQSRRHRRRQVARGPGAVRDDAGTDPGVCRSPHGLGRPGPASDRDGVLRGRTHRRLLRRRGHLTSAFTVAPIAAGVASFADARDRSSSAADCRASKRCPTSSASTPSPVAPRAFRTRCSSLTATAICLAVAASWQASRRESFSFTRLVSSSDGRRRPRRPEPPRPPARSRRRLHREQRLHLVRHVQGGAAQHRRTGRHHLFETANSNLAEDADELLGRFRKEKHDLATRVIDVARYQGEALRLGATDNGQAVVEMGTRRELVVARDRAVPR